MKKIIIVLLVSLIVVFASVKSMNHYAHPINLDHVSILINCESRDDDNLIKNESGIFDFNLDNDTYTFEVFSSERGEVISALKMQNDDMCMVIKPKNADDSSFLMKVETPNGRVELHIDWKPEQILAFNGGIILRNVDGVYFWDYNKNNGLEKVSVSEQYDGKKLWAKGEKLLYCGNGGVHLQADGHEKKLRAGTFPLGFAEDNEVVFVKEMPAGLCLIYKYNISKNYYHNFNLLYVPGYFVLDTAFSPDGRYMLFFSSDPEVGPKLFVMDMKYYTKKLITVDLESDSVQWLE